MKPKVAADRAVRLQKPLTRLLRPLVRLCINVGITFPMLTDLLRELYVNVAEVDFALPEKEQTDSRVSLLTGVHRKEVRRLRGAGAPVSEMPASLSNASRILAQWLGSDEFSTSRGPRKLPRTGGDDAGSFEALVASVTRDVRPRAVLDEWLSRGLVEIDAKDRVTLLVSALVPNTGEDQQLYFFGRNLHDHIAAASENVVGDAPRFFERAVHYDRLSLGAVQRLETLSRELGDKALREANRAAVELAREDEGGHHRWNFGIYIFAEDNDKVSKHEQGS